MVLRMIEFSHFFCFFAEEKSINHEKYIMLNTSTLCVE